MRTRAWLIVIAVLLATAGVLSNYVTACHQHQVEIRSGAVYESTPLTLGGFRFLYEPPEFPHRSYQGLIGIPFYVRFKSIHAYRPNQGDEWQEGGLAVFGLYFPVVDAH